MTDQVVLLTDEPGLMEKDWRAPALRCAARRNPLPLSFGQEAFYNFAQARPHHPLLNNPLALRLTGTPNVVALQLALDAILARHETLRARFQDWEGNPCQVIGPAASVEFSHLDLSADPERETKLEAFLDEQAWRPFNLSAESLFRAALVRLDQNEYILLLTTHQIAADQESWRVVVGEFVSLYEAFSTGQPVALPKLPLRFADFARRQRTSLQGLVLVRQIKQWKRQLGGRLVSPGLPYDRPRPHAPTFASARQEWPMPRALVDSLEHLSYGEGVPFSTLLLTAFQALLSRYSRQRDFTLGVVVPGRYATGAEKVAGPFANLLALRSQWHEQASFRQVLRRTHHAFRQTAACPEIPFERLAAELHPENKPGDAPLLKAVFECRDCLKNCPSPSGLKLTPVPFARKYARFDLTLNLRELPGGLIVQIEYKSSLFNVSTMTRFLADFETLLRAADVEPDRPVAALSLTI